MPPAKNTSFNSLFVPLDQAVEDFCRFIENLPPEVATQQAWGPKEVLAHLVYYHELYVAQAQAYLAGTPSSSQKGATVT